MRRIVDDNALVDRDGTAWRVRVHVPWVDRPHEKSGLNAHSPAEPQVTLVTPNDPDHWAYGEDGPTFDLAYLRSLVAHADRAVEREAQRQAPA